uniref:SAM-dependent methyltransferase n=1 Tax=Paulinella longichromatophora TaxID=1708747 RepID=A0A2H4ZQL2_9EUKA|nr:hypothetical protein PLO_831 [Paulinella longichromatophora]
MYHSNVKKVLNELPELTVDKFLADGFNLRFQLAQFLGISKEVLEIQLLEGPKNLVEIYDEIFNPEEAGYFYEISVGTRHLLELASWHLSESADYIGDTLRLQASFARGHHLDFGGGIGTHALAAASMPEVEKVWFVDLNPYNRAFAEARAKQLGLQKRFHCCRDLSDSELPQIFDTITCLDVLEHIKSPSDQLDIFADRIHPHGTILLNWYFFKGFRKEYPFHFDERDIVEKFFHTISSRFIEVFHPYLITARTYKVLH